MATRSYRYINHHKPDVNSFSKIRYKSDNIPLFLNYCEDLKMDRNFRKLALKKIAASAGVLSSFVENVLESKEKPTTFKASGSAGTGTNIFLSDKSINPDGTVNFIINFRGVNSQSVNMLGVNNAVVITARGVGDPKKNIGSELLSQQYGNAGRINSIIENTLAQLRKKYPDRNIKRGKLILSGFSGGVDPIASLLNQRNQIKGGIDGVIMNDGLHVNPDKSSRWKGVKEFAQEAAQDKSKMFKILNTRVIPPYTSTTETSDRLLTDLGLQKGQTDPNAAIYGFKPANVTRKGGFEAVNMYDKVVPYFLNNQPGSMGDQHVQAFWKGHPYLFRDVQNFLENQQKIEDNTINKLNYLSNQFENKLIVKQAAVEPKAADLEKLKKALDNYTQTLSNSIQEVISRKDVLNELSDEISNITENEDNADLSLLAKSVIEKYKPQLFFTTYEGTNPELLDYKYIHHCVDAINILSDTIQKRVNPRGKHKEKPEEIPTPENTRKRKIVSYINKITPITKKAVISEQEHLSQLQSALNNYLEKLYYSLIVAGSRFDTLKKFSEKLSEVAQGFFHKYEPHLAAAKIINKYKPELFFSTYEDGEQTFLDSQHIETSINNIESVSDAITEVINPSDLSYIEKEKEYVKMRQEDDALRNIKQKKINEELEKIRKNQDKPMSDEALEKKKQELEDAMWIEERKSKMSPEELKQWQENWAQRKLRRQNAEKYESIEAEMLAQEKWPEKEYNLDDDEIEPKT